MYGVAGFGGMSPYGNPMARGVPFSPMGYANGALGGMMGFGNANGHFPGKISTGIMGGLLNKMYGGSFTAGAAGALAQRFSAKHLGGYPMMGGGMGWGGMGMGMGRIGAPGMPGSPGNMLWNMPMGFGFNRYY